MQDRRAIRIAGFFLLSATILEGAFVFPPLIEQPTKFLMRMGFLPGTHNSPLLGWLLGLAVAAAFIAFSSRLPSVRANLVKPSWLKLVAICLAVAAGVLEEWFFRGWVMDWALDRGWNGVMQVLLSGITFGAVHAIWAVFRGSFLTGLRAALVTGVLGALLGIVYLASSRSLAPCIFSHFLINFFIEPGLVLAAARGEMSGFRPASAGAAITP